VSPVHNQTDIQENPVGNRVWRGTCGQPARRRLRKWHGL